jgi:NADPH:quinone reductase-like Zn-dependent oxidoreductase
MPDNTAAWLVATRTKLAIKPAPYTAPKEGEIVVRNRAVAINPVDWALQILGTTIFRWIKFPVILGEDLAGEVAEVGPGVARFKVGDRVLGQGVGLNPERNRNSESAFQIYVVVPVNLASPIPDTMSFEEAAVLPLGLSTAACGLFQKDFLALQHPSAGAKPTGKTLLVWGGATSVGCNAIQLAVAAGYEVFTTASPRNFEYLKKLGAAQVFDYHSRTVVRDIIKAMKGKTIAGALAIATGSTTLCLDIVGRCRGNKFVAIAGAPISLSTLTKGSSVALALVRVMPTLLGSTLSAWLKSRTRGIRTNFIFGGSLVNNEVGAAIYENFLPQALAQGRYIAAPPAQVVGNGLDAIETGFAVQKKGVSAEKVVVSL